MKIKLIISKIIPKSNIRSTIWGVKNPISMPVIPIIVRDNPIKNNTKEKVAKYFVLIINENRFKDF